MAGWLNVRVCVCVCCVCVVCVCVRVCICSRSRPSCAQIRHVQDWEARQSSRMGQAAAEGPRCPLSWGDRARSHAILSFYVERALSLFSLGCVCVCVRVIICELHTTGKAEVDWVEDYISVSSYPLSGAVAAGKFCNAFEDLWSIL